VLLNEQSEEGDSACIGPSAGEAGGADWYISQADVAGAQES